jgi:hypothetical protein
MQCLSLKVTHNVLQLKDVGVPRLRDRSTKLFATSELEPNQNPGAIGMI